MNSPFPLLVLTATLLASGCRSTSKPESTSELRALEQTIEDLYVAFCFDPGLEPDWQTQRDIYLEGAVFVPPLSPLRKPIAEDEETFLAGFREFVLSEEYTRTGLHERIIGTRIESFGGLAQVWVAFEGFHPADGETVTRGLDSLQFVRDGAAWRLVSFATQYEGAGLTIPERYLGQHRVRWSSSVGES